MLKYIAIIFILLSNNANAKIFCDALIEEIKEKQVSERLDLVPLNYTGSNSLGIELMMEMKDEKYVFSRNSKNNVIIFHTLKQNAEGKSFERSEQFFQDDVIVSINNLKVNELTDEEILKIRKNYLR